MDISLYFQPVDFSESGFDSLNSPHTLGHFIQKDSRKEFRPGKGFPRVVIFGVQAGSSHAGKGTSKAPDEIRKQLYRFSNLEGMGGIIDLGNLKPGKSIQDMQYALRDVVEYLSGNNIIAVILGGSQDISIGIARAFREEKDFVLTVVDARVDLKTTRETTNPSNFLSKILMENPALLQLQLMGLQSHLVPPSILDSLREKNFDYLRLGDLRDNFNDAEPLLRHTTFLSFDASAIRQAEARTGWMANPGGLTTEEACRISHYAGLGTKIKAFGVFETNPEKESGGLSCNVTAQIIWYFLDALAHRVPADPAFDPAGFNRFFAGVSGHELVFFQQPSTDRWWIEVAMEGIETLIIPCREKDYLMAMKDEIPDLWWKYARKTEKYSK
jgi:arginase family enzyme